MDSFSSFDLPKDISFSNPKSFMKVIYYSPLDFKITKDRKIAILDRAAYLQLSVTDRDFLWSFGKARTTKRRIRLHDSQYGQ